MVNDPPSGGQFLKSYTPDIWHRCQQWPSLKGTTFSDRLYNKITWNININYSVWNCQYVRTNHPMCKKQVLWHHLASKNMGSCTSRSGLSLANIERVNNQLFRWCGKWLGSHAVEISYYINYIYPKDGCMVYLPSFSWCFLWYMRV